MIIYEEDGPSGAVQRPGQTMLLYIVSSMGNHGATGGMIGKASAP